MAFRLGVSFVDISSDIQSLDDTPQSLAADFHHIKKKQKQKTARIFLTEYDNSFGLTRYRTETVIILGLLTQRFKFEYILFII